MGSTKTAEQKLKYATFEASFACFHGKKIIFKKLVTYKRNIIQIFGLSKLLVYPMSPDILKEIR